MTDVFNYSPEELADMGPEAAPSELWPDPIPLNQRPAVPTFPVSALPPVIADYVTSLAEATQTPVDMPAAVALAGVAACIAGRVTVHPNSGWTEPACLYVVTAMEPGNRKSAVFSAITAPIREVEKELMEAAKPAIAQAEALREVKDGELNRLKKSAINSPSPETEAEYLQAAQDIAEYAIPVLPRLLADDATPEAIGSLAAAQGGRIAIAAAEGGIFDIFAGRYSSGISNLEVLLRGHAGDSFTVDRKGRDSEHIESLTLTFVLTVQPSVLRQIGQTSAEKSRGELERFLYAVPESLVGHRTINPDPVPPEVAGRFQDRMKHLARTFASENYTLPLTFDQQAQERFVDVQVKNEHRLRKDGVLGSLRIKGWGSKLSGTVARIAGILHMADGREGTEIAVDLVDAADRIGDYFARHALAAFDLMDAQGENAKAEELLATIRRYGLREFSERDLFTKSSRSRFPKMLDLSEPMETLLDHGWIVPRDQAVQTGPGRRRSPRFVAHPLTFSEHSGRSRSNIADSVDSAATSANENWPTSERKAS